MKRRLVAVTLSLIMTMATVSEAGAAAFTSPDAAPAVATQTDGTDAKEVNVTEETSERINQAVKELLLEAKKRANDLLISNRPLLDAAAKLVLKKKMVSKKDLDRLLAKYTKQSDEE